MAEWQEFQLSGCFMQEYGWLRSDWVLKPPRD